jgi:hypothetical protein
MTKPAAFQEGCGGRIEYSTLIRFKTSFTGVQDESSERFDTDVKSGH